MGVRTGAQPLALIQTQARTRNIGTDGSWRNREERQTAGQQVILEWNQSAQRFRIVEVVKP